MHWYEATIDLSQLERTCSNVRGDPKRQRGGETRTSTFPQLWSILSVVAVPDCRFSSDAPSNHLGLERRSSSGTAFQTASLEPHLVSGNNNP